MTVVEDKAIQHRTGVHKEENQYSGTKGVFKGVIQGRFSKDEKI